jgi:hypothetical protein
MRKVHAVCRRLAPALLASFAVAASFTVAVPRADAAAACAQPVSAGDSTTSSDSRFILLAAIGARFCDLCLCDVDGSGATMATDSLASLNGSVGLPIDLNCPSCGDDAQCPGVAQVVLLAMIRGPCSTDADCGGIGTCDTALGRCRTVTDLDVGWTGIAHNSDLNDGVPSRLELDCDGPAPCGECPILGLDPQLGNCRCENDNRIPCFSVLQPDVVACGGETCQCYFGPNTPLSSGNSPTCLLNQLREDLSGTIDVDQGAGEINIPLNEIVHLGMSLFQPCPVCENDPNPANGVREGVCNGGLNDGESCDAQTFNSTFPAPGGGFYSLDCFPDPGLNISGQGLKVNLPLTTGASQLDYDLTCDFLGMSLCPCRMCSGDTTLACSGDADCSAAGAGTCTSDGTGQLPRPNACSAGGLCLDNGNEEGECEAGPDNSFCDGIVRADGGGLIACLSDIDCDASTIGMDAGSCSIVERRPCFLDPLDVSGMTHPVLPVAAGLFCTPPTSSQGINTVSGLVGPTRWTQQALVEYFCADSPLDNYVPGTGGCPGSN